MALQIKIRVFVPKEVINIASVNRALQHKMISKTAPELKREFERTTTTWKDKPFFRSEHYFGARIMWVKVYTEQEAYRLVNAGARPHIIRPRRVRMLRFQTGFRPKSRPRLIGAFAGGKFGSYISTPLVHHPGHEAREFDKTIAEEYLDTFAEDIQDAIKDGIKHT